MNRRYFPRIRCLRLYRDPRPRLNVFNWSDTWLPIRSEFERNTAYACARHLRERRGDAGQVMSGNSGWTSCFRHRTTLVHARDGIARAAGPAAPSAGRQSRQNIRYAAMDAGLKPLSAIHVGVTGIVYQTSVTPAPKGWADLWDERLRGRVTMLDDPVITSEHAQKAAPVAQFGATRGSGTGQAGGPPAKALASSLRQPGSA